MRPRAVSLGVLLALASAVWDAVGGMAAESTASVLSGFPEAPRRPRMPRDWPFRPS